MAGKGRLRVTRRLLAAAEGLHRASTLDELEATLATQLKLWKLFRACIRRSCCKSPEFLRLADYVLTTLSDGRLPEDRSIAALAGINARAGALIMGGCPRQLAQVTDRPRPGALTAGWNGLPSAQPTLLAGE